MKEQALAVQRMQDYIALHLREDISMAALARTAMFSPWYSYRIFRAYTGLTPADYIRRLRLTESAKLLKSGGCCVTGAAMDMGFGSVDGYIRAFERQFGLTPGAYAESPVPLPFFIPYGAKFREMERMEKDMEVQSVFVQQMHKPERKVLCKRGKRAEDYFAYCEEVGCDVWGVLMSMDSLCGEPVCLWLPPRLRKKDTSVYVQGVEVSADYSGPVPDGFDVILLPEAEYLMFQGEPFREEDYCEAITAVQKAMEKYDPAVLGMEWDDENPRVQLEPRGERGYIELRSVKKKK